MLGGIYYIERDIMNVVTIFHKHEEEDMGKKKKNYFMMLQDCIKGINLVKVDMLRFKMRKLKLKLKLKMKNLFPYLRIILELMLERRRAIKKQKQECPRMSP